ncbi:MAG: LPS export ABC transporter permease LptF [Alphaproteobacteria bacterium]|nr:LPS export ABC transporter permease LptF [Alphaproteobacteria bacterium]
MAVHFIPMRLIERYFFRQFLWPTLAAAGALTVVAILSEAVSSLRLLISDRASALVFAKVILLATPQLLVLILPIAILVAALIALNRLHTENEIVICFAGGASRWRVISPAVRLACLATLASFVVTFWIQPISFRAMRDTLEAARTDLVTSLIRPGAFTHPAPGLTVYAQSVDQNGVIHNLFIDHASPAGRDTSITAQEGRLTSRGGAPVLLLRQGANAAYSRSGGLEFLSFDEYALDVRSLLGESRSVRYKPSDRFMHELFFPDRRIAWDVQHAGELLAEGHARIAAPLYNLAFMGLALAAILGGAFSRMGYGGRIAVAAAAALGLRIAGLAAQAAAAHSPALNLLQYGPPLLAIAGGAALVLMDVRLSRSPDRPPLSSALATA